MPGCFLKLFYENSILKTSKKQKATPDKEVAWWYTSDLLEITES
jgi:hypothetical protein